MQCHELFRGTRLQRSSQKHGQQAGEHGRKSTPVGEQLVIDFLIYAVLAFSRMNTDLTMKNGRDKVRGMLK